VSVVAGLTVRVDVSLRRCEDPAVIQEGVSMKLRVVLAALVVAAVAVPAAHADPAKVGYPNSIASTGDSITRAFNTCGFPFIDCTSNSWSTGTSSSVNSVYSRILARNGLIAGRNRNDARTGARMIDLNGQVTTAGTQGVELVTILMGANDVCTSSEASMTPVATLRAQFRQALETVTKALPNARIAVSSIPNIYNLWSILRPNSTARFIWSLYGICQSMLANANSTAQADVDRRARVAQRNRDDNDAIAAVCAEYVHCRFDANAAYNLVFTTTDVSTRDYFHPSVAGQAKAAAITWANSFDYTDQVAPASTALVSGGTMSVTATDNVAVSGVEYRFPGGSWARYTGPVALATGQVVDVRAVDVNGNIEASHTIIG
jgi:lysophospholipase L1-like esterase